MTKFSHIDTWIFDLDDTLYHPSFNILGELKRRNRQHIADKLSITYDEADKMIDGFKADGKAVFVEIRDTLGLDFKEFISLIEDIDLSKMKPCKITKAKISSLKGKKAVFSNSPNNHVMRILEKIELENHFDHIIDAHVTNFISKPLMEAFDIALEELGIENKDASSCILIEDNICNLKTAKELGMTTVLVHHDGIASEDFIDYQYPTLLDFFNDIE